VAGLQTWEESWRSSGIHSWVQRGAAKRQV